MSARSSALLRSCSRFDPNQMHAMDATHVATYSRPAIMRFVAACGLRSSSSISTCPADMQYARTSRNTAANRLCRPGTRQRNATRASTNDRPVRPAEPAASRQRRHHRVGDDFCGAAFAADDDRRMRR